MRRLSLMLGVMAMVGAGAVRGEDWPKWLGPRGDGISKEVLPDALPAEPKKLWSANVGVGYSSPIGVGGKVYVFMATPTRDEAEEKEEAKRGVKKPEVRREELFAFDAEKGTELFRKGYVATGLSENNYAGTRATPTFEEGKIYTLGGGGTVTCWDANDGKILWQTNTLKETSAKNLNWGVASSPLIVGDRVYVQGGINGPLAVGLNKKSGKIEWKAEQAGEGGYAHVIAIDVEGTKQLVVFGNKGVYGVSLESGKTVWSEPWKTEYDISATTPVYRDGHLLVSSGNGRGSLMLKLRKDGATKEWDEKEMQARFQAMILDGDYLYGNSEGKLKCLHWPEGKLVWKSDVKLNFGGSIVKAGNKLVAMSDRGKLYLLKTDGTTVEALGEASLFDAQQVWTTPLLYQGKLYAKGGEELACFSLR